MSELQKTVIVIRDSRGYLHVPAERGEGGVGVCGAAGEWEERPIDWAGMWCTDCLQTYGFQVAS